MFSKQIHQIKKLTLLKPLIFNFNSQPDKYSEESKQKQMEEILKQYRNKDIPRTTIDE